MYARHRHAFGLFTLLVMSWAAVWCCCVAPVRAQTRAVRPCCEAPVPCPMHVASDRHQAPTECPLVQVRQTAVAPVVAVVPSVDLTVALPHWLGNLAPPVAVLAVVSVPDRLAAPTGPPTLLAMHTSLLW